MSGREQIDIRHMERAYALARRGLGRTNPNPAVGAVVASGAEVLSEGYHRRAGSDHAEIEALNKAGDRARGASLYVTLEPCAHQGRTPACAPEVARTGVARVVVGVEDPNPLVAGKGLHILRRAGLEVDLGLLADKIGRLNRAYNKYIVSKTPFVIVKAAASLDGRVATRLGMSQWITSEQSRAAAHGLRARSDAIMVGADTVIADDPMLTVRLAKPLRPEPPLRIVADSRLRAPLESRLYATAKEIPTLAAATTDADPGRVRQLESMGVEVAIFDPGPDRRTPLPELMRELGRRQVMQLLVEGGGALNFSCFNSGVADRVVWIQAPIIIGGRDAVPAVGGQGFDTLESAPRLGGFETRRSGPDLWIEADVLKETL